MSKYKARLTALRQEMKRQKLDAFIIPHTDAWQAESLFPHDERLRFICGLQASAGYVVVTMDHAAVMIDGRYTLQAKEQVDQTLFDIIYYTDIDPEDWAAANMPSKGYLGLDPWLHTQSEIKRIAKKDIALTPVDHNPVDAIWQDQPAPPVQRAIPHDLRFAGMGVTQKLDSIAHNCEQPTLIAAPDSLAWLLNLRVLDNTQAPGLRGYGVFTPETRRLDVYTDVNCSDIPLPDTVILHPLTDIKNRDLTNLAIPKNAPAWFSGKVIPHDPCALPKACKNTTEQQGIRDAHHRDAVAMTATINWIKSTPNLTEKEVDRRLIENRAQHNMFRGVSFDSIVGWNVNGAKIHGNPTDTIIKGDGLLLIDSGGQYDDGTTDITRTIAIGTPSQEMKEKYTLVLKAHIALATAIFPAGTTGIQLDALVRAPLWAAGIDFAHGTGHGVGYFLNVHEGPCGISPRSSEPLLEGMLLSNEPGYYKEGAFGIRLENLMLVQKYKDKDDPSNETGKDLLCFETVTLVPFDDEAIIRDLLSPSEQAWLAAYHDKCGVL